jgi:hypothetical protein
MIYADAYLRKILDRTKTVALVGLSANSQRPSYAVAQYLTSKQIRVIGVNPGLAGQVIFGVPVRADLASIPEDVDMVDIFRRSDAVPAIVDAALARWRGLPTIWMQIGVTHVRAARVAQDRGVDVVQNRCPKIEYQRLFGDL